MSSTKELRVFGLTLAALLSLLALKRPLFWAPAGLLVLTALARPALLGPLVKQWMRLARVLAAVNTFIVLAVVYYLVLSPVALLMRLGARDLLEEEPSDAPSYWKTKKRRGDDGPRTYERQF